MRRYFQPSLKKQTPIFLAQGFTFNERIPITFIEMLEKSAGFHSLLAVGSFLPSRVLHLQISAGRYSKAAQITRF